MKLHIHHNPEEPLEGYTNICLSAEANPVTALDLNVDASEVTELIANNVLEYIPLLEMTGFLAQMISKLRHGGTLILTGTDAYTVAKDYVAFKLSIEDFNILLHGTQKDDGDAKLVTLTLHGLVNFLKEDFGLTIVRQILEDYTYVIEARRP